MFITTSGTTPYTITVGSNANTSFGTLSTGSVSGATFTMSFQSNGTVWQETGLGTYTNRLSQVLMNVNGSVTFGTGPINVDGFAVASLPASPATGAVAYVTDQTTACPSLGGTFTGGGSVKCLAFYNGSSWIYPSAPLPTVGDASGSPSATFGVLKADGTTITCSSGTCSAVGSVATSITVGTTTVGSASGSNQILTTGTVVAGTGTLANVASTALVFTTGTLSLSGNLTTTGAYNPTFAIGASVTYTFPGSTATLASLNIAGQTVTGGVHVTSNNLGTVTSGTTSLDDGTRPTQYMTNGGASTLAADTTHDGSTAYRGHEQRQRRGCHRQRCLR